MNIIRVLGFALFLMVVFAAAAFSMDARSFGIAPSFALPPAQCADIGRAGVLPAEQSGYLGTAEFADSLESVASGMSRFSPSVVPPEWKGAARTWREQVSGRSVIRSGAAGIGEPPGTGTRSGSPPGEGFCYSSLVYRAFLDFRSKTEQPDLMPVYPYQVRKASAELSARFERVAHRARSIESSIREAERMGARECSPSELTIAWAELELAGRSAAENGYDIGRTEAAFAHAERAAGNLLVKRQLATNQKFVCYSR